jgi:hypothetical protein
MEAAVILRDMFMIAAPIAVAVHFAILGFAVFARSAREVR